MKRIHRARLALVAAGALSLVIIGFELPIGTLLHQRSELASASVRLRQINAEDAGLSSSVASLRKDATVAAIAHAQYGLVQEGQIAYAILPRKGSTGAGTLGGSSIAPGDLVADTVSPFGAASSAPSEQQHKATEGFWHKVLDRLEFWRAA